MKIVSLLLFGLCLQHVCAQVGVSNNLRAEAEKGDAQAQYTLGWEGLCTSGDKTEALEWLRKAADKGHADAQFRLGQYIYHYDESGIQKNDAEAVKWLRKSAEQGHATAAYYLGMCYMTGAGVSRSAAQAYIWCSVAVALGEDTEAPDLRDGAADKLFPDELDSAKSEAAKLIGRFKQR